MRAQTNGATMVNGAKDAKRALAELEALRPGTRLAKGAFEVVSTRRVMPYDVVAVELEHVKTGAKHLHVGADDSNSGFNVAFRTTPRDSTGVAHVLEHTVFVRERKVSGAGPVL